MTPPTRQQRFLTLLDEHRKILFKVAGSYCRNSADRADLMQEMVLQLWRSFERHDEDRCRFSTWMYRVTLNVAISFCRTQTRRPRHSDLDGAAMMVTVETPGRDPDAWEGEASLLQQVVQALNELDRALLILHLDGNRYDTIAEILGISETNVGTRLSRIKQRLRREWTNRNPKEQEYGTR